MLCTFFLCRCFTLISVFLCYVLRCNCVTSKGSFSLLLAHPSLVLPLSVLLSCLLSSSGPHMGFILPYCNPAQNYFLFQFPGEVVKWFLNQTIFFTLSLSRLLSLALALSHSFLSYFSFCLQKITN